jgi:predicted TIM-barrel fold metal-dependent hydrolase
VPPGSVDTHAHVVGEHGFVENRSFTPPPATAAAYTAVLDATGMTYGVLVQVSVHGTDNTLLLDTLRAHPDRLKGVAVPDPATRDAVLGANARRLYGSLTRSGDRRELRPVGAR